MQTNTKIFPIDPNDINTNKISDIEKNTKKDFVNTIQPMTFISSLVGLKKVKLSFGKYETIGRSDKAYIILFSVLLSSYYIYIQYGRFMEFVDKEGFSIGIIDALTGAGSIFTSLFIIFISSYFSPDLIKEFYENIEIIDELLSIDKSKLHGNLRKILFLIESIFFGVISLQSIQNYIYKNHDIGFYMYYLLITVIGFSNMEYIVYVYLLKIRVENLNLNLKKLDLEYDMENHLVTIFTNDFFSLNRTNKIKSTLSDKKLVLNKVQYIYAHVNDHISKSMKVYDKIADNVLMLNNSFGVTVCCF